jgi:hypothetical protein
MPNITAKETSNVWAFRERNNVYWKHQQALLGVTALGSETWKGIFLILSYQRYS